MAEFCSSSCVAICDFCKNYKDEDRDIKKIAGGFAGEGVCDITKQKVEASDGASCNDFKCFQA